MFRWVLLKMTVLYLSIIMVVSLFFSLNIYRLASQHIIMNAQQQQTIIQRRMIEPSDFLEDPTFLSERNSILTETKNQIIEQLLYTNLVILVLGGGLSYFLAQKTLRPIEEAHQSQVRFTSDASHELRSPIAAMQSEIEVALRDPKLDFSESKKLLKSNLEELNRLTSLSENLLQLARENGIEKKNIPVESFIKPVVEKYSKIAAEKDIKITASIQKETTVYGDEVSLSQLISILLDNAIKYSERGKDIKIVSKKEGRYATISISDRGIGIKDEDIPRIFDRFFRADQSRSKNQINGYGLGLSIAQKIVSVHKGKIEAKSIPEKGTTFTIKLPINKI